MATVTQGKTTQVSTEKWRAKDVITLVLLSVLLIAIQLIINMLFMFNNFLSMVLSVGVSMLFCAPVYFLMVRRVHKRFASLIYTTLVGLVFLLMGDWFLLPYLIFVGAVMEAILWKKGSYDSQKRISIAWVVYSFLYLGINMLPLWFFWDEFESKAIASGMTPEYIASFLNYYSDPLWLAFIVAFTVLCGFIGAFVSSKLMKKHFEKSGVL